MTKITNTVLIKFITVFIHGKKEEKKRKIKRRKRQGKNRRKTNEGMSEHGNESNAVTEVSMCTHKKIIVICYFYVCFREPIIKYGD